jgi:putative aldouronate transport system substrate-binding protein
VEPRHVIDLKQLGKKQLLSNKFSHPAVVPQDTAGHLQGGLTMKKQVLAIAMAAAMASTMVPGVAMADDSSDLPTITFMVPEYNAGKSLNNEGSDQVIEAYESYTGIHADITWADNGAYDEILGTTLMDIDNMPMIITVQGSLTGTIVSAANEGAFWDLTDLIDQYPNLSTIDPSVRTALSVNGQVIGLPRSRELGRYGLSYRKDWAEAVGITEDPQTVDDVYDMLYKFTYGDPDGNGQDDTYGMEMTKYTGPFDIVQTWFGCGNGWVDVDGELVPVHQTAEYKEALDWLRKVYADGLMRSDWATIDTSEWSNGCKKGEDGVYIDVMDGGRRIWDYFVQNNVASVSNPDELASMRLLGPVNGHTMATSGYNGFFVITVDGAKTEEDVANCLTFLDKLNDYDMRLLADYGIEGVSYDLNEDGNIVMREIEAANMPQLGLNQMETYTPSSDVYDFPVEQTERDIALQECYEERTRPVAVSNPALGYLASSETYSSYGSDLDEIISTARTQYICGTIDEAGLEAAWQDWSDKGGSDLIAEVNEMYQADLAAAEEETTETAE